MDFFMVKHPDIELPASVPESALDFWVGRGWVQVDDPGAETAPVIEGPAEPVTTTRARRRSATEE